MPTWKRRRLASAVLRRPDGDGMAADPAAEPLVVVGIDDSPATALVLNAGAREAALRGARLKVVHAWLVPLSRSAAQVWPDSADPRGYFLRRVNERVAELQEERRRADEPQVAIDIEVVEGQAADVLSAAAEHAAMLVLGQKGAHGASAIIGSVSNRFATRPPCPVLIVPTAAPYPAPARD